MSPFSRRQFLATSLATMTAPMIRAADKTAPEFHGAIIGHGDHRYRVNKLWSRADPAKHPVKDCHEMVQAGDGRLFLLTNHPQNNVLIYTPEGMLAGSWTLGFRGAHGLTLYTQPRDHDFLFITDTSGRVVKTTLEGKIVMELPHPTKCGAYTDKEPYSPTETAISWNEDIYVIDGYGSQYVLHFDKDGKYLGKFGGRSTQPVNPGKFMQAHGIALDMRSGKPLLVCTERIRNEFNWFTLEGEHVRGVYLPGAYLSRPVIHGKHLYSGVCFGAKPHDFRMWQGRGFVTILDEKDKVVSNPGGQAPEYEDGHLKVMLQDQPVFNNCHDVCIDDQDDLYVCQWNSSQVYPYKLHREA